MLISLAYNNINWMSVSIKRNLILISYFELKWFHLSIDILIQINCTFIIIICNYVDHTIQCGILSVSQCPLLITITIDLKVFLLSILFSYHHHHRLALPFIFLKKISFIMFRQNLYILHILSHVTTKVLIRQKLCYHFWNVINLRFNWLLINRLICPNEY